jgi:hypothetical protein
MTSKFALPPQIRDRIPDIARDLAAQQSHQTRAAREADGDQGQDCRRVEAHRITIRGSSGEVVLEGSVRSRAERDEAERAAWTALGVT